MIKNNMFINYFKPSLYVSDFAQLNLKSVKRHGIKVFISDLDNTLVPHFKKLPTPEVFEFVRNVEKIGLKFILVSNNSNKRVRRFAEKLGVDYYGAAWKPFRNVAHKIQKKYNVEPHEMVIMGDQLITDILFANRCHMESILVQPQISDDIKVTKLNRFLEKFLYRGLARKNILQQGRFDERGTLGDFDEIL